MKLFSLRSYQRKMDPYSTMPSILLKMGILTQEENEGQRSGLKQSTCRPRNTIAPGVAPGARERLAIEFCSRPKRIQTYPFVPRLLRHQSHQRALFKPTCLTMLLQPPYQIADTTPCISLIFNSPFCFCLSFLFSICENDIKPPRHSP